MILATHGFLASSIGQVDADYQAVLDYATTQGYTLPSAGQQALQNQLVVDLKAAGVWSKLDTFAVFATDGDSDFALIDWIRLSQYTAVNSPTFTTNEGFNGNGTSSYIDTNYNPISGTNYILNNASRIMFIKSGFDNLFPESSAGGVPNSTRNAVDTRQRINQNTVVNSTTSPSNWCNTSGVLRTIHRENSATIEMFTDTTQISAIATSNFITSGNQYLLRGSSGYVTNTFGMYGMGASLVSENSDLNTAWYNYYNAL
jgi:hypothetical protein